MYEVDFSILFHNIYFVLKGIGTTCLICLLSSIFAFIIGSTIFFLRWYRNKITRELSTMLVEFIRNTPLLVQLYIFYKGLPQIGILLPAEICGILALSIYTGVYISEVLRAGKNSVAPHQKHAAFALGLSKLQTFRYVIFPQTIRYSILPLGSQFINLFKNSTLVSFIAVTDLFFIMQQGISDYFRIIEFMTLGIILYGFTTLIIALTTNLLDTKYKIKATQES